MTFSQASGDESARKAATSSGVGGSPVRSSVARRMSVHFSASGENAIPFPAAFAFRKASTGCPALGGAGFCSGRKAHHFRSSSDTTDLSRTTAPATSGASYGAPRSIHAATLAITSSERRGFFSGMCGSSSWRIIFNITLSAAEKGFIAKPSAPPRSNDSRVAILKSPFVFSPP